MYALPNTKKVASFLMMLLGFALTLIEASPIGIMARDVPDPSTGPYNIEPHGIVFAILAIVSGIYFCFFGYRFFKLTMFLTGFWFFGNITFIGMANHSDSLTLILIISIIVGLIGGAILACCWHIGLYFLAALAGYAFALWLLAWKNGGLIDSNIGRVILIIVFIVLFVILTLFFERWMVIIATSILGAYLVILGIDIFAKTGFSNSTSAFLTGNAAAYNSVGLKVYIMLAAFIVLALVGILFQHRIHGTRNFRSGAVAPYGYGSKWGTRRNNVAQAPPAPKRSRWGFRNRV